MSPAAEAPAASRLRAALDVPAGCVCFNLLANPGPPQTGGVAAQLTGNSHKMISQSCQTFIEMKL